MEHGQTCWGCCALKARPRSLVRAPSGSKQILQPHELQGWQKRRPSTVSRHWLPIPCRILVPLTTLSAGAYRGLQRLPEPAQLWAGAREPCKCLLRPQIQPRLPETVLAEPGCWQQAAQSPAGLWTDQLRWTCCAERPVSAWLAPLPARDGAACWGVHTGTGSAPAPWTAPACPYSSIRGVLHACSALGPDPHGIVHRRMHLHASMIATSPLPQLSWIRLCTGPASRQPLYRLAGATCSEGAADVRSIYLCILWFPEPAMPPARA